MAIRVTVHLVVFAIHHSALKVLLVKRHGKASRNRMALLGTRLRGEEGFEEAARRALISNIGADETYLEQLYCSVDSKAKGRSGGHAFSVAYYALLPADRFVDKHASAWRSVRSLPPLGPRHRRILEHALRQLRRKMETNATGFRLLGRKFTLPELQAMYEAVLGRKLDKRNFRKKMASLGVLKPLREWRRTGRKPARLYTVATRRLEKLEEKEIIPPV